MNAVGVKASKANASINTTKIFAVNVNNAACVTVIAFLMLNKFDFHYRYLFYLIHCVFTFFFGLPYCDFANLVATSINAVGFKS